MQPHQIVHVSGDPINGASKLADRYFDKDVSLLFGAGWERIKETSKQTVLVIGVLAAAMYFYEHSKWHRPRLNVVPDQTETKEDNG